MQSTEQKPFNMEEHQKRMEERIRLLHALRRQATENETPFRKWWREGLIESDKIDKGQFGDFLSGFHAAMLEKVDDVVAVTRFVRSDIEKGIDLNIVDPIDKAIHKLPEDWEEMRARMQDSWKSVTTDWGG